MPRTSERAQVLQDVEDAIEDAAYAYLLASNTRSKPIEEHIRDLLTIQEVITSHRYLSRHTSGSRLNTDVLETYIHEYPETAFLASFRMHRASFWKLVDILTSNSEDGYWDRRKVARGFCRPVYQQIAVALYMLGGGGTAEKSRIALNIGHGTIWTYTWRTIELLAKLVPKYVQWPVLRERSQGPERQQVFRRCIGFLDGSNIVLRDKPMRDPEAYFSLEKSYGFNLQAICNWDGHFIWVSMGHTASVHDSTAFKSTALYRELQAAFNPEEYILADTAYSLERHIITPYKDPMSRQPANAAFNYELSAPRVRIEHTFGVLKSRWPTLYNIPVRIGMDQQRGHERVINWTMACIVLHNILNSLHDDRSWLEEEIAQEMAKERTNHEENNIEEEANSEAKQAGIRRRDELRDLVSILRMQA